MKVEEVYEKFGIPPNLQEHMIAVAKVVKYIQDNWIGREVQWKLLTRAAARGDRKIWVR